MPLEQPWLCDDCGRSWRAVDPYTCPDCGAAAMRRPDERSARGPTLRAHYRQRRERPRRLLEALLRAALRR